MNETVCSGCGGIVDVSGIEPFTLCECSDCGAEIIVPLEMDYLKLEKSLGRESAFQVYEGFDQADNITSIIFILDNTIPDYADYFNMAKEEANGLSTLKHPNICPLINFGEIKDTYFVTTPKMDGYSLADYSPETQGLLDVESVIDVLQAAALGLGVAHHKEFVHHNICPENVHIDARGNVRVKNFFISRFTYWADQKKKGETGTSSVSPYFISPEKAESGVEDKRGDIFSFGVLFYFMLTGKYPFAGKSEVETIYSRVKKKNVDKTEVFSSDAHRMLTPETVEYISPKAPIEFRDDIPEEISSMIMDMLSYYPVKRPKFTEILTTINLYKAKEDQRRVQMAQHEMVTTKTRAIPVMKNLSDSEDDQQKSKKRKVRFF